VDLTVSVAVAKHLDVVAILDERVKVIGRDNARRTLKHRFALFSSSFLSLYIIFTPFFNHGFENFLSVFRISFAFSAFCFGWVPKKTVTKFMTISFFITPHAVTTLHFVFQKDSI